MTTSTIRSPQYQTTRDTYELAARILAGENIKVVFVEGLSAPASFDIEHRVLYINRLEESQLWLTPGLVAHEVGHALFTNPTASDLKKFKGVTYIFNCVEDGYQERQYCKKYPGGKKFLFDVFHYFFEGEGHKAPKKALPRIIEILNTLNYNCKGMKHGFYKQYPDFVLDDDIDLLMEAELLDNESFWDRWQFVRKLSAALKKYLDDNKNPMDDLMPPMPGQGQGQGQGSSQPLLEDEEQQKSKDKKGSGGAGDEDGDESDDSDADGTAGKGENKKDSKKDSKKAKGDADEADGDEAGEGSGEAGDGDEEGEGDGEGSGASEGDDQEGEGGAQAGDGDAEGDGQCDGSKPSDKGGKPGDAPKGKDGATGTNPPKAGKIYTEAELDAASDALQKMVDANKSSLNDHHSKLKLSDNGTGAQSLISPNGLMDVSATHDILRNSMGDDLLKRYESSKDYDAQADAAFTKDLNQARVIARSIFSSFTIRKNANNLNATQYRRSGTLDVTRLAYYDLTDDLFMNKEIQPQQTNHGYVAVLDWSGSMSSSAVGLTHRLMELALFAHMADVEFEIWLYTTGTNKTESYGKYPSSVWGSRWVASKLIRVVNTKQSSEMETIRRLKLLWLGARQAAGSGYFSSYTMPAALSFLGQDGTNILEGTILGHGILEKMKAEKKTLFVLTDGDDSGSFDSSASLVGSSAGGGTNDLMFNGSTVRALAGHTLKSENLRVASTKVVTDFYHSQFKHKTVCIEWNCNSQKNRVKFGHSNVISVRSPNGLAYHEMDNVFVKEIVEALL